MGLSLSSFGTLGVVVLLAAVGCSSLPGLTSARNADFDSLRKVLEKEELSPAQVRRLAKETLSAEVVRAEDRRDREFIRSLRSCANPLHGALEKRSEREDGVGAEAALLLLEGGRLDERVGKYRNAEDGAWRALAARASKNDDEARQRYFTDPDERVRRTALSAALEAADPGDVPHLLEVSRLDPDPLTRNRAFQTLAKIGGPQVSVALEDRFDVADEELRLAIVDAWGKPALYTAGGREELRRLLTHEHGFDALHAAHLLAKDDDESLRNRALHRLIRFSKDGSAEERRMAIRFLPSHEKATVARLLELTETEDAQVAVIAWARLLGNRHYQKRAQKNLFEWADSDAPVAFQARAALAAGGDEGVLPLMLEQMRSKLPENRKVAGNGLVRLGALSEVAPLLADEDEGVRRDIACRILRRPLLTQD